MPFLALGALILAIGASAGAVSTAAGFQGDDGNLADDGAGIDWNTFAPAWTGTAPSQEGTATSGGWDFTGLEDWQETTADSAFAGGTKQDDECASVGTGKAPNKDDLKRAYFASATGANDHIYLALAWVRIPQNTTSSSAHVGFEFNKGVTPCGAGSDSLVERTVGDRLVVYDFEGGSSPVVLKLLKWQITGICDASGKAATSDGCWVFEQDLTAAGNAEAKVNTGNATDAIAPAGSETLASQEFGEAIIDLTAAGVFTAGQCESFGSAFAVSRSSGNSSQAQMKDLVGPGDVDIKNCGSIVIRKVTSPSPDSLDTSFGYTTTGGLDPSTFSLKNGENQDYGDEVQAGSYSVSETTNANYTLSNISCSASTTSNGSSIAIGADSDFDAGDTTVSIDLAAEDSIDCTYTNTLKVGALIINKKSTKTGNPFVSNAGAVFAVDGPDAGTTADFSVTDDLTATAPDQDADAGQVCVSGLLTGTYTINETTPPSGYGGASQTDLTATVVAGTNCDANLPGAGATVTFTNAPLYDLQVNFNDDGSGETSATISCSPGDPQDSDDSTTAPSGWDSSKTYNNEVAPASITCTIEVDP